MRYRVTMIDYGGSNLRSVQKALEVVEADVTTTSDPAVVSAAEKLILPGVGAFGAGMEGLRRRGLDEAVRAAVRRGASLLGICLGMQLLFDAGEEMGHHDGLGLISGRVICFPQAMKSPADERRPLKIPHMGWNRLRHYVGDRALLRGVPDGAYAYFVHSYYCEPGDVNDVLAYTDYGLRFAAVVGSGNVYGFQFHPEKSQKVGLQMLRNFVTMSPAN